MPPLLADLYEVLGVGGRESMTKGEGIRGGGVEVKRNPKTGKSSYRQIDLRATSEEGRPLDQGGDGEGGHIKLPGPDGKGDLSNSSLCPSLIVRERTGGGVKASRGGKRHFGLMQERKSTWDSPAHRKCLRVER